MTGQDIIMKTYVTKLAEIERQWFLVDATDKTLGRLASELAQVLKGKHKPNYAPNVDVGDFIVVINAEKIAVTGRRLDQKVYYRHSGYPGGLNETKLRDMLKKHPERPIKLAVKGMLPKNVLGRQMLTKLKVFVGPEHNHQAQKPELLEL
ncbi:MAG: large subunit ribosomal protein L13 [Cellvibrionaceae bacterium]|jgi:large subunit ribosomal protein L13